MKSFAPLQYSSVGAPTMDRSINTAGWLPSGITIASGVFSIEGSGLTFSTVTVSGDIMTSSVTPSATGDYEVNIKITLSDGNVEYRSADLKVLSRKSV